MKYKGIEIKSELLDHGIELDALKAYIDHRRLMKFPLQQRTFDRIIKKALTCESLGLCSATEVLDICMDKSWRGLEVSWIEKNFFESNQPQINKITQTENTDLRNRTLVQDLADRSWIN